MSDPYRRPITKQSNEPAIDPHHPSRIETWISERSCPTCLVPLVAARKSGIRLDACTTCGGTWMSNDDAQRMLGSTGVAHAAVSIARLAEHRAARQIKREARIVCPDCGEVLAPRRVGPIEIDVCAKHGTWFDRGELAVIVDLATPSLEVEDEGPSVPNGIVPLYVLLSS